MLQVGLYLGPDFVYQEYAFTFICLHAQTQKKDEYKFCMEVRHSSFLFYFLKNFNYVSTKAIKCIF